MYLREKILSMAESGTVLVVGGGATGTGVARDLALRGVDVTLVEQGGLASGTSGWSHGVLHSDARYAESDRVSASECIAENRTLRSVAGECVRETGGLFVQMAGDDDYFERRREACTAAGIETELTGRRPVNGSQRSPQTSNERFGFPAVWCPRRGPVRQTPPTRRNTAHGWPHTPPWRG